MSGSLEEALSDLTGLINSKKKIQKNPGESDLLWKEIVKRLDEGALMGCSIINEQTEQEELMVNKKPAGVLYNHAYGIIQYV